MKEILFYGYVGNFSVRAFIENLTAIANSDKGAFLKVNSGGGDVDAGWGVVSEWRAFKGSKKIIVHGAAHSMMAIILLFTEDTTAIEQSKFLLHRASSFFENDNPVSKKLVDETNSDIRKAFEDRLDIPAFEEIGREQHGVTFSLSAFFDSNTPAIDIVLNATQAKAIGLVKNIVSLNAKEANDINKTLLAANAAHGVQMLNVEKEKTKAMKKDELKANHPDLYKEIYEEGKTSAVSTPVAPATPAPTAVAAQTEVEIAITTERERVASWDAWREVDPEAVTAGIASGLPIGAGQQQKFIVAQVKKNSLAKAETDSPNGVDTPEAQGEGKTKLKAEVGAFLDDVLSEVGLPARKN